MKRVMVSTLSRHDSNRNTKYAFKNTPHKNCKYRWEDRGGDVYSAISYSTTWNSVKRKVKKEEKKKKKEGKGKKKKKGKVKKKNKEKKRKMIKEVKS